MTDLTAYIPSGMSISQLLKDDYVFHGDPRQAFEQELVAAGFKLPKGGIIIGRIVRIDAPDDKKNQLTGWYIYNEVPDNGDSARMIGIATYGSWRGNPDKVNWVSKGSAHMSDTERSDYNVQLEAMRIARDAEQLAIHAEAAQKAVDIYNKSQPVTEHPYLSRKGIPPLGDIRSSHADLVLPLYTAEGTISSLQFIKPDGGKKFLTGGRKKGCYFVINGTNTTVYIAEGYATAASVHMATACTCYIAFDAGNLYEVSVVVKAMHPTARIVIAADDDVYTGANAGRTKAMQAADTLGLEALFPVFTNTDTKPTDWNDLHALEGIAAVQAQLTDMPVIYEAAPTAHTGGGDMSELLPAGILLDIMHYYNATSGNKQPMFAIQTAIAIVSVICARSFESNFSNRSSLFMLNLGSSGTGKEHIKRVIENVLDATGNGKLIASDGYTAGSSVFSALMERPRHITVVDEFSKYLQAAQNKYSGSHMMEANSQLMQVFGRLDGTMRPKSYATIGLTKDKRKEMADLHVTNPAITLVAMSTPENLFEHLDIASVKDGFLNRFLVCVSDAPRAVRKHREKLEVPQAIKDWASMIAERRGNSNDIATDPPALITLTFTDAAVVMQDTYQQECIDLANSLERFGLAEMPMRCNEIAMRLALCHALSVSPQAELINDTSMAWAIAWVRCNTKELIKRLKMSVSGSEFEGLKKAALSAIRALGKKGITFAKMQTDKPFSTMRKRDLAEVLDALEQADLIFKQGITSGKRGRPTVIYYATQGE